MERTKQRWWVSEKASGRYAARTGAFREGEKIWAFANGKEHAHHLAEILNRDLDEERANRKAARAARRAARS